MFMSNVEINLSPICCGAIGALSGIFVSFCVPTNTLNGCFPVVLGSGIGSTMGCIFCLQYYYREYQNMENANNSPIILRNMVYDTHTGEEKK